MRSAGRPSRVVRVGSAREATDHAASVGADPQGAIGVSAKRGPAPAPAIRTSNPAAIPALTTWVLVPATSRPSSPDRWRTTPASRSTGEALGTARPHHGAGSKPIGVPKGCDLRPE